MPKVNMWVRQRNHDIAVVFATWLVAGAKQEEIDAFFKGEHSPAKTVFAGMSIQQIVNKCEGDENLCALLPQSLKERWQDAGCLS